MKSKLTLSLMLLSAMLRADIVEIQKMKEALLNITPDTLVVFDLDNTVVQTVQTLGSVQWADWHEESLIKSGLSKSQAIDIVSPYWVRVQLKSENELVEETTDDLIRDLQKKNVRVLALTARPVDVEAQTKGMLQSFNIAFQKSWPDAKYVSPFPGASYQEGVLFVGQKNSKGAVLKEFMAQNSVKPKSVRFIDDKRKYLDSVEGELNQIGIPYTGYRYGGADDRVASLDPEIATVQMEIFEDLGEVISDAVALRILEASTH